MGEQQEAEDTIAPSQVGGVDQEQQIVQEHSYGAHTSTFL